MKIAISLGFYILFLIANIEGRFLLVNVGNPDVDDDYDDPRKQTPVNFGDPDVDDPRKEKPEIEPNLAVKCCELKGVPRKCIYACDLKTEVSQREANNYERCTNYMDVIDNCRKASMPKCPSCCPLCFHGFCADPEICPEFAPELVKSKDVSDGEERRVETDCKVFENPDNECRKNSFCICISRDGKRICPGYSNCKFGNLQEKWNCACQWND